MTVDWAVSFFHYNLYTLSIFMKTVKAISRLMAITKLFFVNNLFRIYRQQPKVSIYCCLYTTIEYD